MEEEITYIVRSGNIFRRKFRTTEWEKAKKLLADVAEKSKDGVAYLDVVFSFPANNKNDGTSFSMPYAVVGSRKKSRDTLIKPIHVENVSELKKPVIHKGNYAKLEDVVETAFTGGYKRKK